MTTQFAGGAEVIEAMNDRSEETWLVADSSKYGRAGFVSVLELAQLNGIVTDSGLAAGSVEVLKQIAPTVRVV